MLKGLGLKFRKFALSCRISSCFSSAVWVSGISYLRGKSRQKLRFDYGSCSHWQKPFGPHTSYFYPDPGMGSAKSQVLCTWHFQSIQQHEVAQRHVRDSRRMGEKEKLGSGSGHIPNPSHLPQSWSRSTGAG